MDGALKTVVMMGDEFMRREKSFSKRRRRQRGPSFSRPIIGKSLNGFMSLSHHGHQLEGGAKVKGSPGCRRRRYSFRDKVPE